MFLARCAVGESEFKDNLGTRFKLRSIPDAIDKE